MRKIIGILTGVGSLKGTITGIEFLTGSLTVPYAQPPGYTGPYEVTPSSDTQYLNTDGMYLNDKIKVNPIPDNYGLITWNGSVLTVS